MRGVASAAPAVIVGQLADATQQLRIGAGGVLLPNHAPLVIAEQFGTLEALHPGRIDLGLGRALGGPAHAAEAVRSERTAIPFQDQITELLTYFDPPAEARVRAVPAIGHSPPVWMLGSSETSAKLAGSLGLPYAFAHHLNPTGATTAMRTYRDAFEPSVACPCPQTLVSVSVIAADTDDHVEWLAGSTRLKVLSRIRGHRILLPSPDEAEHHPYTDDDRKEIAARAGSVLVGSPSTVCTKLQHVLDETGTDELMMTTPVYNHTERCYSYKLVRGIAKSLLCDDE